MEASKNHDLIEELLMSLKAVDIVPLKQDPNWAELTKQLAEHLNGLVTSDFTRLLSILYRIDVSEVKLQAALKAAVDTESAGQTIARLIVERQRQKIILRNQYRKM